MNIYLKNITKIYGRTAVLDNLSICFESGKLTALLGPSGCGKTTILNTIAGVIPPNSGNIYLGTECVTDYPLSQRNIGYVFQNYSLYPNMTAYDNLIFPLTNIKFPAMTRPQRKEYCREKVHSIAKLLQVEDTLSRFPSELSGGQQQRVALGRAIIRDPDILLMDEPFANLDRKLSIEMREEVREIQQSTGITTIFVTHNQADANAISDKIILLKDGAIQQADVASEIYDHPSNTFVADFFGEHGSNIIYMDNTGRDIFSLISALQPQGVSAISFRPEDVHFTGKEGPFKVKSKTRLGGSWIYILQHNTSRLSVLSEKTLEVGDSVSISLDENKVNYFDKSGTSLYQKEVTLCP